MGAMEGALAKSARFVRRQCGPPRVYMCVVRVRYVGGMRHTSPFCASSSTRPAPAPPSRCGSCQVVSQESMKGVECQRQSVCVCVRAPAAAHTLLSAKNDVIFHMIMRHGDARGLCARVSALPLCYDAFYMQLKHTVLFKCRQACAWILVHAHHLVLPVAWPDRGRWTLDLVLECVCRVTRTAWSWRPGDVIPTIARGRWERRSSTPYTSK